MAHELKQALLALLAAPGLTAPFYPLMRGRATIFMLHRFRDLERGIHGVEPALVRRALALLRRRDYELADLEDLLRRLGGNGRPVKRAVAFTIDDGYAEQADVAGPVFAEYDCPVTTFVTTGFLDGELWFWWDRIAWIVRHTTQRLLRFEIAGAPVVLSWSEERERLAEVARFTELCKTVPDVAKHAAIVALAEAADVEVPAVPPPDCQPMTWDQLRACERRGMRFGPHTVTHPVLSRTTDEASRREIIDSWVRLSAMAVHPTRVFCYPNGGRADFGAREVDTLRQTGLLGGVVGTWGIASSWRDDHAGSAFRTPRIPFPDDLPRVVQYVSGVEEAKMRIRGGST